MNEAGDDHVSFTPKQLLPSPCGRFLLVSSGGRLVLLVESNTRSKATKRLPPSLLLLQFLVAHHLTPTPTPPTPTPSTPTPSTPTPCRPHPSCMPRRCAPTRRGCWCCAPRTGVCCGWCSGCPQTSSRSPQPPGTETATTYTPPAPTHRCVLRRPVMRRLCCSCAGCLHAERLRAAVRMCMCMCMSTCTRVCTGRNNAALLRPAPRVHTPLRAASLSSRVRPRSACASAVPD